MPPRAGGAGVEPAAPPYQRGALPPELSAEWARLGSNQQPLVCKTSALPLELLARTSDPGQGVEPRSPRSERGVLPVRRSRNGRAPAVSSARRSVEERDVPHRTCALFGIHHDPVPAVQGDRRVIGMADRALCEQLRVADEARPAAATS